MKLETVDNKKNWITIVGFIIIGVILNLPSFANLFDIYLPSDIERHLNFAPFLFIFLVVLQRKNSSVEVEEPITWAVEKRKNFFLNKRKTGIRYALLGVVVLSFFLSNIYSTRGGFNDNNLPVIVGFLVVFGGIMIYQRYRKNFKVGYCNKGVVFGYSSRITLVEWKSISDFVPEDEEHTISVYFSSKLSIQSMILKSEEHYDEMKPIFIKHLEYKNVSKLLTGED